MKHTPILYFAAALATVGGSAFAQTDSQPSEKITVVAPYVVTKKEITASPHQRFLDMSIIGTASYGDLDLGKAEDVGKLKTRISDTAKSLCKQLEQKYPPAVYVPVTNQDCVKTATDGTMETVNLLASAYRRP